MKIHFRPSVKQVAIARLAPIIDRIVLPEAKQHAIEIETLRLEIERAEMSLAFELQFDESKSIDESKKA